jgi:protein-S-isoprenylcysteine O-methyltransferase Ste14
MAAGCTAALLLATPFRIVSSPWLTLVSVLLAVAGITLHALSSAPAVSFAAKGGDGPPPLSEYIAAGGIYSVTRFPSLTADLILVVALAIHTGVVWFALGAVLAAAMCTGWVLLAREHSLQSRYGEQFTHWCRGTHSLTPYLWSWKPWNIPVSPLRLLAGQTFRTAIMVGIFTLTDLMKHLRIDFEFRVDVPWLIALAASVALVLFSRK